MNILLCEIALKIAPTKINVKRPAACPDTKIGRGPGGLLAAFKSFRCKLISLCLGSFALFCVDDGADGVVHVVVG